MQRVVFEMSFAEDVPDATGNALASLIERFFNDVNKIIPTPRTHIEMGEISPERNDNERSRKPSDNEPCIVQSDQGRRHQVADVHAASV